MSDWNWTAIGTVASAVATAILAVVTVWMASLSKRGLDAEERREKSRRTPFLIFDFSDGPEHANLGAPGFRHLESKVELLVSGTIRNVGNTLAVDVRLDIFHYLVGNAPPVHEICAIHVADALPGGGSSEWSRTIGNADLTVQGPYIRSGIHGLSAEAFNKCNHFHVVFSCKNADGEDFCSIYCMERVFKGDQFERNQMKLVNHVSGKYDPGAQFSAEWRDEIQKKRI